MRFVFRRVPLKTCVAAERRSGAVPGVVALPLLSTALLLAGCSADIARFDSPSFALNDKPVQQRRFEPSGRVGSGSPIPGENSPGWNESGPRAGQPLPRTALQPLPPAPNANPRVAALPPASNDGSSYIPPAVTAPRAAAAPSRPQTPQAAQRPTQQVPVPASGQTIDVVQGDTLYGLSKKHKVSIAALMEVNSLKQANLKPGQKLVLPQGASASRPATKSAPAVAGAPAPTVASAVTPDSVAPTLADVTPKSATPRLATQAKPEPQAPPSVAYDGQYVVKQGDSLFNVARAHRVTLAELQRLNGISDPKKVRPGTVLRVPTIDGSSPVVAVAAEPTPAPTTTVPQVTAPKIINAPEASVPGAPQRVARLPGTANDASPAPKFRWPAQGKVITAFNNSDTGIPSDGIAIAVPQGTDIHAAEAGQVAYASNELKGYGNLVLIRHENGFVTAYAHTDRITVKRGDTVKRGQVIATAGRPSDTAPPQIQFELRQGTTPIDPTPYLER